MYVIGKRQRISTIRKYATKELGIKTTCELLTLDCILEMHQNYFIIDEIISIKTENGLIDIELRTSNSSYKFSISSAIDSVHMCNELRHKIYR